MDTIVREWANIAFNYEKIVAFHQIFVTYDIFLSILCYQLLALNRYVNIEPFPFVSLDG